MPSSASPARMRLRLIALVGVAAAAVTLGVTAGHAAAGDPTGFSISHPAADSPGLHTAEEPSIGDDWNTGAAMYLAGTTTYKVTFDANGDATWTDVSSAPLTSQVTFDPILFTDSVTGRTIVSQLDLACSLSEYTDDDGATWVPSEGCGPNGSEDHQTVGGGPFHSPLPAPPSVSGNTPYPHAVYYCNQDGGALVAGGSTAAYCALSVDGGATYQQAEPIYTMVQCGGLHGHLRVAPDGTAVIPNQDCAPSADVANAGGTFTNQAAVVTTNDGLSWTVNAIPGSHATLRSDPALAFDKANTMYFGYEDGVYAGNDLSDLSKQIGGHAMLATSSDDGAHWSTPVDVGAALGIQNVTFPEVIAGDAGHAAYAFLGSTTAGNPEDTSFQGLWYLYVASTSDGGKTWTTSNLTPGDPVERDCIYLAGDGSCPSSKRNLLDFMDITADKDGRVLVGYADGCTGLCVTEQTQPCADAICSKGDNASTDLMSSIAREDIPSLAAIVPVETPEAPWTPALVVASALAVAGVWWRRSRRQRGVAATSA
jgi:hypothetical protein